MLRLHVAAVTTACLLHLAISIPVSKHQIPQPVGGGLFAQDPAIVQQVNEDENSTWTAEAYHMFSGMSKEAFRSQMLGLLMDRKYTAPVKAFPSSAEPIPESFDSYATWPDFTHPIRDQAKCGSCWAFAASECLSDRFAIATNGTLNAVLSPEDMVSCDSGDMGCHGGYIDHAWDYLEKTGIVTDECMPYGAGKGKAPACPLKCADGSPFNRFRVQNYYQLKTEEDIQREIMTHGPVEAGFRVYTSFMSYKSGVYQKRVFDMLEGGHAIKIVGWGVEPPARRFQKPTPYWLCANSWTASWGLNGFFKIRRGANRRGVSECGIQEEVFAGLPLVTA